MQANSWGIAVICLPALRKTFQVGLLLLAALVIAALLAITLGIRVNLDAFRPQLQAAATERLGRQVRVEGPVSVKLGLWPTLTVREIKVSNPPGWGDDDLAHIGRLQVQLSVLALLKLQIRIGDIEATNSSVALERRGGKVNWMLRPKPTKLRLVSVDQIVLMNSRATYKETSTHRNYTLSLRRVHGSASAGEPVRLALEGTVQGQTMTASASGGPLADLRAAAEPWPIQTEMAIAGTSLKVRGQLRPLDLHLTLAGDQLGELVSLAGTEVPRLGAYKLIGRLGATETGYRLSHLRAKLAGTDVSGTLAISDIKRRPFYSADLAIGTLNVEQFWGAWQHGSPSRGGLQNGIDRDRAMRALLGKIRASVNITIQHLSGIPLDVRHAGVQLVAEDGSIGAAISGTLAEIPLRGHAKLEAKSGDLKLQGAFLAEHADISRISRLATHTDAISGNIARLEARMQASSPTLGSLEKALHVKMVLNGAKLSYRRKNDATPLLLALDDAALALGYRQPTEARARGILQGKPFSITLSGGEAGAFVRAAQWPVELTVHGAGTQLHVKGHISPSAKFDGSNLSVTLSGKRIGELAPLVGMSSSAMAPYRLQGTLSVSRNARTFRIRAASLGSTALSGIVGQKDLAAKPVLFATLNFQTLALAELNRIFGRPTPGGSAKKPLSLDRSILPQHMRLPDADIKVTAAHVRLGQREIRNASVSSRIRNGWISHAPFGATVEGQRFAGNFTIDLRASVPKAGLLLITEHSNIGELLRAVGSTKGVNGSVGSLRAIVDVQGTTLRQLLRDSSVSVLMNDTQCIVRDPDTPGIWQVRVREARYEAGRDLPTTLTVQGSVNKKPIRISLLAEGLRTLERPVQFELSADAAETHLDIDGTLTRPLLHKGVTARISLAGQHLDTLSELLPTTLPPFGSYSVRALLHLDPHKLALSDLHLRVGKSALNGHLSFETVNMRPRLEMSLYGKTVQLDDFPLGKQKRKRKKSRPKKSPVAHESRQVAALTQRILSTYDAELALHVDDVRSGTEQLGEVDLKATLKNGRLLIEPLQLQKPGSSARMTLVLQQTRTGVSTELQSVIKNLDYGPLTRWLDPERDRDGVVNLNTHLTSQAPKVGELLQHANGYFDLGIHPEHYQAGLFNLWAVNLITTILPLLDPDKSTVNCVAGTFNVVNGDMRVRTFLIDTTKVQVKGKGHIDFHADKIDLQFKPRAKRLQFVNLGVPVKIRGSIDDFRLGVNIEGLIGTTIRLGATFYMPFTALFYKRLPANDTEACKAAMQRTDLD
jgi:uncharacterized protein involved in outer membrane biogenesis